MSLHEHNRKTCRCGPVFCRSPPCPIIFQKNVSKSGVCGNFNKTSGGPRLSVARFHSVMRRFGWLCSILRCCFVPVWPGSRKLVDKCVVLVSSDGALECQHKAWGDTKWWVTGDWRGRRVGVRVDWLLHRKPNKPDFEFYIRFGFKIPALRPKSPSSFCLCRVTEEVIDWSVKHIEFISFR